MERSRLIQLAAPQTGARLGLPAREVPSNARGERVAHDAVPRAVDSNILDRTSLPATVLDHKAP
jgi:hypothetical protein